METLIYIVLLVGAVIGFYQGAFKQIANFAGVIGGIVIACMMYDTFGDYLSEYTGASESTGQIVAFLLIVLLVPVLLGWLATLLTKLFKEIHLGFINRLAGAVIGVVCFGMLMSFAFNLFDFAKSELGTNPEKLEARPSLYYTVKHASQFILPDFIIVTDDTEKRKGNKSKDVLKESFENLLDKMNY